MLQDPWSSSSELAKWDGELTPRLSHLLMHRRLASRRYCHARHTLSSLLIIIFSRYDDRFSILAGFRINLEYYNSCFALWASTVLSGISTLQPVCLEIALRFNGTIFQEKFFCYRMNFPRLITSLKGQTRILLMNSAFFLIRDREKDRHCQSLHADDRDHHKKGIRRENNH